MKTHTPHNILIIIELLSHYGNIILMEAFDANWESRLRNLTPSASADAAFR